MNILITGGTGSFGQAMTRHLIEREHIHRVAILSRDELKQAEMRMQLEADDPAGAQKVRYLLGDVRDGSRLEHAFRGVDVVIHAAALKRVESGEYNPREMVRTNVEGAQNVIDAAIRAGVRQVIAISTDKAVNPANLYGATKMTAERLFLTASTYGGPGSPAFCVIRYGNVAGSRGSVIPLWRRQLRQGEPLTITHPDMTRFWYTLAEATELVHEVATVRTRLDAQVLVPIMRWYSVGNLATAMIGSDDYPKTITGMRPGEKMHECLIGAEEMPYAEHISENLMSICFQRTPPKDASYSAYTSGLLRDDRLDVNELIPMLEKIR